MSISSILQQFSFDIIGGWSERHELAWSEVPNKILGNDAKFPGISQCSKYKCTGKPLFNVLTFAVCKNATVHVMAYVVSPNVVTA